MVFSAVDLMDLLFPMGRAELLVVVEGTGNRRFFGNQDEIPNRDLDKTF